MKENKFVESNKEEKRKILITLNNAIKKCRKEKDQFISLRSSVLNFSHSDDEELSRTIAIATPFPDVVVSFANVISTLEKLDDEINELGALTELLFNMLKEMEKEREDEKKQT